MKDATYCLSRLVVCFPLLAIGGLLAGCSSNPDLPETVPAKGKVLYNGEPVAEATVTFRPEGGGKPAVGMTDAQGQFQLSTYGASDGAVPGKHTVTVSKFETEGGNQKSLSMDEAAEQTEEPSEPKSAIPTRYADPNQSDLTFTVKEGETNEFTIELSD